MQECSWRQRVIRKRVPAQLWQEPGLTERTGCWLQETVVQKGVECGPQQSTFLFSYQQDVFQKSQTISWWKHNDSLKVATRLLKGQRNDCWSNLMDDVNVFRQNGEFRIEHQICYLCYCAKPFVLDQTNVLCICIWLVYKQWNLVGPCHSLYTHQTTKLWSL